MRRTDMFSGLSALALVLGLTGANIAAAQQGGQTYIPERRVVLQDGLDIPGGDLRSIFDVGAERCIEACLADDDCQAFTYNTQSRSCFPKAGDLVPTAYEGAVSGIVVANDDLQDLARNRANQLDFLSAHDFDAALQLARGVALRWGPLAPEPTGNKQDDAQIIAAAGERVAQFDKPEHWLDLARALYLREDAAFAAINAFLRSDDDEAAAAALVALGRVWDNGSNGPKALSALRLAADLSGGADIISARDRLEDRWGMRIVGHDVKTDTLPPQVCLNFSSRLSDTVDYTPYLRLPEGDLTVEVAYQDLCISGLQHGSNVELTARAGLPDEQGEVLSSDVTIRSYIGNRSPSLRFAGRAYVLPASGDRGLEVVTVNADSLDLSLLQVSDRNLVASMRADLFARPLDGWAAEWLSDGMATEIWSGSVELAGVDGDPDKRLNADVATRLAIPDAVGPLAPGAYVLKAALPDAEGADYDPYSVTASMAAQWFVVSDLGLTSLWAEDRLTVVVRGLSDAQARKDVRVALVSQANEVLSEIQADAEGVVHFDAALARGRGGAAPAMVTATQYEGDEIKDMSFLSWTEAEFDLSDRGVAGMAPSGAVDVFMATDRGVYRAGETVNVTALARDGAAFAVKDLPLTAILTRPDGVEAARVRVQPDAAGGYVYSLPIAASAPTGTWRLEMRTGDKGQALAFARILVEDFLPERIDFSADIPQGPLATGAEFTLSLDARWLYDAPAADLPVNIWLRTAPAHEIKKFPGYRFGIEGNSGADQENIDTGKTDAQGRFQTDVTLPQSDVIVQADFMLEVSEGSGRPVNRQETRIIMPDAPSVGIQPLFEGGTVSENENARFRIIAIDRDQEVTALAARWVLTRLEHEYVWYRSGSRWNWEVVTRRSRVTDGEVDVTAEMPAILEFPVEWGDYELRVEAVSDAGSSAVSSAAATGFRAGWAMAAAGSESPDRLDVRLDKAAYSAGDKARLTVEATGAGIGIITVLTNRIVDLQLVALQDGSNIIEIPVTDEWGAGAYVTASAIRPLSDDETAGNRDPVRSIGLAYAPVDPAQRRLAVSLDVPQNPSPRQVLPVRVKVDGLTSDRTAHATIAVVDQGILNITAYTAPDPEAYYFGQRRLGVALRDIYGRLIMPTGAADGKLREGGDAQGGIQPVAPPPTEVLMAHFSGPVQLDENGVATVDIPVPDFNGTVRVMAVVWTEEAIGQADQEVVIRDPVVATVTAPRFLALGDVSGLRVDLTHTDGPAGQVVVNAQSVPDILDRTISALPATVELADGGSARLELSLAVPADAAEGLAALHLGVTAPDDILLGKDITIPVIDPIAETALRARLTVPADEEIVLNDDLTKGLRNVSQVTLAAGPLAMLDIPTVVAQLRSPGYGSIQQIVAAAAANLYIPELVVAGGRPGQDSDLETIEKTIARVLTRQDNSGAFGTWYAGGDADLWQDAFVTDFLSRARAAGHEVPEQPWQSALGNLRNAVGYATNPASADPWENAALAYAAYVLARERAISVGDLRYYVDAGKEGFKTPLSAMHLAGALAFSGDDGRAGVMMQHAFQLLTRNADDVQRRDYGSPLREYAAVYAVAVEAGLKPQGLDAAVASIGKLLDQRLYGPWMHLSSQEAFWLVLLAKGLIDTPPALLVDGEAMAQVVMPVGALDGLRLASGDGQPVIVTLTATGRPLAPQGAGGDGYSITRHYEDVDGAEVDISSVEAGTLLRAVLTVRPLLQDMGYSPLVIRDGLPAGFEIERSTAQDETQGVGPAVRNADMESLLHDSYLASLTISDTEPFRLTYMVRAVHPGRYTHPQAVVSALNRPQLGGWTGTTNVEVVPAR